MEMSGNRVRLTVAKLLLAMSIIGAGVAYVCVARTVPGDGWNRLSFDFFRVAGFTIVGLGCLSLFTPQVRRAATGFRVAGVIVLLWALLLWHLTVNGS